MLRVLDRRRVHRLPSGERADERARLLLLPAEPRHLLGESLVLGRPRLEVGGEERQVQRLPLLVERLVLARLPRLALDGAELSAHFLHHVSHPLEVQPGRLELALRLRPLLLVAGDAGGLLDEDPALPGLGRQHVVQALLVHQRVGLGIDAGAGEQVLDVAQPARIAVEEILALTRAVEATGHADLAPRHGEPAVILEDEAHLRHAERLAGRRAVEDHVLHLVASEQLGALLSERPAHGVGDVGLAAAVGTHDAGDAREDLHLGLVGERLEPVNENALQSHRRGGPAAAGHWIPQVAAQSQENNPRAGAGRSIRH